MKITELDKLAEGCNAGACNVRVLLYSLNAAVIQYYESPVTEGPWIALKDHPAMPVIFGHLSFLCGDGLGPSSESLERFDQHFAALTK